MLFVDDRRARYQREQGLAEGLLQEVRAAATDGVVLVVGEGADPVAGLAQKLGIAVGKGLQR